MTRTRWGGWALMASLGAGVAGAQVPAGQVDERLGVEPIDGVPPVTVQLRAGIADYTGGLGDSSDVGPLVGVTVDARRYRFIGAEVGYEGTRNAVSDDVAVGDAGAIWRHNVAGMLKGGPRIQNFLPFLGAGIGASYVNVTDDAVGEGFENDFIAEVPLAAGVEYRLGSLTAGLRGTYRVQFDEDFAENTGIDDSGGNLLSGTLSVGGTF